MIEREIRVSARLPQVRPLKSRCYSRGRLGSHGRPSDEQMATISGPRHVHSLYLGGTGVGGGRLVRTTIFPIIMPLLAICFLEKQGLNI